MVLIMPVFFFFSSCLSILQWMMWLLSRNKACTLSASPIKNPSGSLMEIFSPELGFRDGTKSELSL